MIDRTTLDLRIADHAANTAIIERRAWQRQGEPVRRPIRTALADVLVQLATRLAPSPAPYHGAIRPASDHGIA